MSDRKDILSELSLISPSLAEIPFKPVFTVPPGYFVDFPGKMIKLIKEKEDSDVDIELLQLSPLLASLGRKTPFSVPEGYFAQLEQQLTPETQPATAKIVRMNRTGKLRTLYAAAAITAIVGLFSWFYIMNNNNVEQGTETVNIIAELPSVSETEISSFLATTPENIPVEPISLAGVEEADFDEIMDQINENELQQFIKENPTFQIENMN